MGQYKKATISPTPQTHSNEGDKTPVFEFMDHGTRFWSGEAVPGV